MINRLPREEYEAVAPQGDIATAVEMLHDAANRRRLALIDDERADRHVAAEVRQQVRKFSWLAEAFRL